MWTSGVSTGQEAVGVVEGEGDFGRIHRPAGAGAVEDHVGHFPAAEALDALLAQHPLDGVDDVRFPRAVRTDDDGDSLGEFKTRLVGEALETGEFECLEHAEGRSIGGPPRIIAGGLLDRHLVVGENRGGRVSLVLWRFVARLACRAPLVVAVPLRAWFRPRSGWARPRRTWPLGSPERRRDTSRQVRRSPESRRPPCWTRRASGRRRATLNLLTEISPAVRAGDHDLVAGVDRQGRGERLLAAEEHHLGAIAPRDVDHRRAAVSSTW